MSEHGGGTRVVHDEGRARYEIYDGDDLAGVATYHPRGDAVVLDHTVIERARRNQGLGAVLVRGALDDVRERGLRVVPTCSFVAAFIHTHPEYADLLARRESA